MPFPSLQASSSSTQCYQLAGRLSGEANRAINCLTINDQGTFLVSGGLGYLIFWMQSASLSAQFEEVIVKPVGTGGEITCMTFDNDVLTPTLSIQLNVTVPEGITFVTGQDDFHVRGMYNREITRMMVCKPKQVAFGEKGSVIIWGGESGVVCDRERETTIIAGTSKIAAEPTISIWRHACCSPAGKHHAREALNHSPPIQSLTTAVSKIFWGTSSSNETLGVAAVPELMHLTAEEKKWYMKVREENWRREQKTMERMKTMDSDKADLVIYV
ncbi:hypothetical protein BDN67DRAFT_980037 [Paxillus ammoniavirescens]|nr:hypothetical protein BDN67DRAFT_980037 [Paxillus ammoniavirescens]